MTTSIAGALDRLKKGKQLDEGERRQAVETHTSVREKLLESPSLKPFIDRIQLSGSYKRHTAVTGKFDVDMLVVLRSEFRGKFPNGDEALTFVKRAVEAIFTGVTVKQHHSIGLKLPGTSISVDIVPLVEDITKKRFYVPRLGSQWVRTFPLDAGKATTDANQEAGGRLLALIRLLKYWNGAQATRKINGELKKPFKSFHLEVMACDAIECEEQWKDKPDSEMLKILFQQLHRAVTSSEAVTPPGGGRRMDDYLVQDTRRLEIARDLLEQAMDMAVRARSLELGRDIVGAHACWKEIFPDYEGRGPIPDQSLHAGKIDPE